MPGPRRSRLVPLAAVLLAGLAAAGPLPAGPAAAGTAPEPGIPTATPFAGIPTVGPLFRDGTGHGHGCTASVVDSPHRDLLLTAAHCVRGTAAGWTFAPGYRDGRTPYGVWTVTQAYVDPAWSAGQDPRYDYAFLRVAGRPAGDQPVAVEDVTGGNRLGSAPPAGSTVTDVAYNAGIGDRPVRCTVPVSFTDGFPTLDCHGYVGGSSGSPWLAADAAGRTSVEGVIGGPHQGGCHEYTSYSPAFTAAVRELLRRATLGLRPDTVPKAGGDGC